jgi:hypothetical protein
MNKYIIAIGAGIIGFSLFSLKKIKDYKNILDQLTVNLHDTAQINVGNMSISNSLSGAANWINIDVKLKITNPTKNDFSLSGLGLITVKEVFIYDASNKLIANAQLNESQLKIGANDFTITKWLPLELPIDNLITSLLTGFDPNQFKFKVNVSIVGAGDYLIG